MNNLKFPLTFLNTHVRIHLNLKIICPNQKRHKQIINHIASVTILLNHKTTILPLVAIFAFGIVTGLVFQTAYAQSDDTVYTSKQTTLSKNLANDPVAQDILKKIEQTKKWIADLEKRNYDYLQSQREVEEKRERALAILYQDLIEWEKLWEDYTPRNAFKKFVDKQPDYIQGVFWEQFKFTESKTNAGKDAFDKVRFSGGTFWEAREAYLVAAATSHIELIEANSKANVKYKLAIYDQQLLFNPDGQFDVPVNGEQLRKYFEDYRTNPEYLKTNPDDSIAWSHMVRATPHDECREGYILIYRITAFDSVCVTQSTADMWIRYGMAEIRNNVSDE